MQPTLSSDDRFFKVAFTLIRDDSPTNDVAALLQELPSFRTLKIDNRNEKTSYSSLANKFVELSERFKRVNIGTDEDPIIRFRYIKNKRIIQTYSTDETHRISSLIFNIRRYLSDRAASSTTRKVISYATRAFILFTAFPIGYASISLGLLHGGALCLLYALVSYDVFKKLSLPDPKRSAALAMGNLLAFYKLPIPN